MKAIAEVFVGFAVDLLLIFCAILLLPALALELVSDGRAYEGFPYALKPFR